MLDQTFMAQSRVAKGIVTRGLIWTPFRPNVSVMPKFVLLRDYIFSCEPISKLGSFEC